MQIRAISAQECDRLIKNWPNVASEENARMVAKCLTAAAGGDLARIYPMFGTIEGLREAGFLKLRFSKWFGFRDLLARFLFFLSRSYINSTYGDRPGVNDLLMAKWLITRNSEYLVALNERAKRDDAIGFTCRWMLFSVAAELPELKASLEALGSEATRA